MPHRRSLLLAALASCISEVPVSNPYDPALPPEQQQKARLSGSVGDRAGGPLEGATVTLDGPSDPVQNPIVTDASGTFDFGDLVPGTYGIDVAHPTHLRQARDVILAPGEKRLLDLVLDLGTSPETGHLAGVVQKSGELARAAGEQDHSGILVEVEGIGLRTITNRTGRFDLDLTAGAYDLVLSASDYRDGALDGVVVSAGATTDLTAAPIVLDPNPGRVLGVVTLEGVLAGGHAGTDVTLLGSESTTTDQDGNFTIADVAAGTYLLQITRADFRTTTLSGVVVEGGRDTTLPALLLEPARGTIRGTAQLAGRGAHDGILIELTGTSHTAVTNVAGEFQIERVAVGTYALTAYKQGFVTATRASVTVTEGATTTLSPALSLAATTGEFTIDGGAPYTTDRDVILALANPEAVRVRVSEDPTFADADWEDYLTPWYFRVSLGAGEKTIYVQYEDGRGAESAVYASSIVFDDEPPSFVGLSFAQGSVSGSTAATLRLDASGADEMCIFGDVTDAINGLWVPFQSVVAVTLARVDADNDVIVELRDFAGNPSQPTSVTATLYVDRTAPVAPSVTIDGGAPHTKDREVLLALASTDDASGFGVEEIAIANAATLDCDTATYRAFSDFVAWQLPAGDGDASVTVCFRDGAGNSSSDTATITLDTQAPTISLFELGGGSDTSTTADVPLALTISDNLSTYPTMQKELDVSAGFEAATRWLLIGAQPATHALPEGKSTVYLRVTDSAGNATTTSASITVDTVHPLLQGASVLEAIDAGGIQVVSAAAVTLDVATLGADEMRVGGAIADSFKDQWIDLATLVSVNLTSGDGNKTITVEVRDAAGNVPESTPLVSTSVRLDTTAPATASFTVGTLTGACASGNENWVRSVNLPIALAANDARSTTGSGVAAFQISEDPTFGDAVWQTWAAPAATTANAVFGIDSDQGEHTLYARVRDYTERVTSAGSVCVTLDTVAPTINSATSTEGSFTGDVTTDFALTGFDAQSASLGLQVSGADSDVASVATLNGSGVILAAYAVNDWLPWPSSNRIRITWQDTEGTRRLRLRARDAAQNVSTPYDTSVVYDRTPPTAPELTFVKSLNGGAELSWTGSTDATGSGVAGYVIFYRKNAAPTLSTYDDTVTVSGTTAFVTRLENKQTYWFGIAAIDRAGVLSALSNTDSVATGWQLFQVVSNDSRRLVPQSVIYRNGKIYLLYHEETVVPLQGGASTRRGSEAKLAISEDGGETWRFSIVSSSEQGAGLGGGPVPGRVTSRLWVGERRIGVITSDFTTTLSDNRGTLAELTTEDEGLIWHHDYILGGATAIGSMAARVFPFDVAVSGSSRVVYFTAHQSFDVANTNLAVFRVKNDDDAAPLWQGADRVHDTSGARYSACNANFTDRVAWMGEEVPQGYLRYMTSPFHGGGRRPEDWAPADPTPLVDPLAPGEDLPDDGSAVRYATASLGCAALGSLERFYFLGVRDTGRLHFGWVPNMNDFNHSDGVGGTCNVATEICPILDGTGGSANVVLDESSPVAAWAGDARLFAAFRTSTGDLAIAINDDPVLQPNSWRVNYVDQTGDAGYNPVVTGYGDESIIVAYTDLEGTEINLARAALLAPQVSVRPAPTTARFTWSEAPGAQTYAVVTDPACVFPAATNEVSIVSSTSFDVTDSLCLQTTGHDDRGERGDRGPAWLLKPFADGLQLEGTASGLSLGSSRRTGIDSVVHPTTGNQVVAALSADPLRVRVFVSTDGGQSFPSTVDFHTAALPVESRDVALTTTATDVIIHVAYQKPAGAPPFTTVYRNVALSNLAGLSAETTYESTAPYNALGKQVRLFRSGTTLAAIYSNNNDVKFTRSTNNGGSWSAATLIANDPGGTSASLGAIQGPLVNAFYSVSDKIWMRVSEDNGATWTAPNKVLALNGRPKYLAAGKNPQYFAAAYTADDAAGGKSVNVLVTADAGGDRGPPQLPGVETSTWATLSIEDKEDVVIYESLDLDSNSAGVWFAYSVCSDLGLTKSWKLKLAYCSRNCHSREDWNITTLKDETGTGNACTGNWYNGLALRVDPTTKQIFIAYTEDPGSTGTAARRVLMRGGYLERTR
jgi:hypothetical protein